MEKPYFAARRERYNPGAKRYGFHGHTVRHTYAPESNAEPTLERSHEASLAGSYAQQLADRGPLLAKQFALTAFELDGYDVHRSLGKDGAWDAVPQVLAEHCIAPPCTRRTRDGVEVTSLSLAPVGVVLPDPALAAAAHRLTHEIYAVTGDLGSRAARGRRRKSSWRWRVRGLRLHAELPSQPPALVMDAARAASCREAALLPARLGCATCKVPQGAIVRVNAPQLAFSVPEARGRPLLIDLGGECAVFAFATQGRHPPTRQYPRVAHDARDGWVVEGRPDWPSTQRYREEVWTVLTTEADKNAGPHVAPQWVSRYELQWRAEHGREWHSLGAFAGNTDATSEVAHLLDESFVKGGLTCRYLRLLPLETHGGGAVRIGVYGAAARGPERRAPGRRARGRGAADDGVPEAVTYTLTAPCEGRTRSLCRDGSRAYGRCRCSYCLARNRPAQRQARQRQAERDAQEASEVEI